MLGHFGDGETPLHKPYPYSWHIGEDTSILGTNEMFGDLYLNLPGSKR